jgi:hypothetical protein
MVGFSTLPARNDKTRTCLGRVVQDRLQCQIASIPQRGWKPPEEAHNSPVPHGNIRISYAETIAYDS